MKLSVLLALLSTCYLWRSSKSAELNETAQIVQQELRILRVNLHADAHYMRALARITENGRRFSLLINLNRELGSNYFIMNMKLRAKFEDMKSFGTIFALHRLDFCAFLADYEERQQMQVVFKLSTHLSHILLCPLSVGNYTVSTSMGTSNYAEFMRRGIYKFFVEVVARNGEIAKVFSMQVTSALQ